MENLLITDTDGDRLSFGNERDGIVVVTNTLDADNVQRVGIVRVNQAQARQLYMWLAEAIGVVEKGYNKRQDDSMYGSSSQVSDANHC